MFDFVTADWHLGETRMEIMQRPYTTPHLMLDDIKAKHNDLVKPDDKVLVVGDVISNHANNPYAWLEEVSALNGIKTLIRGNHDKMFTNKELSKYFDEIVPESGGISFAVGDIDCYATHYPTRGRKDRFNLVGHIHGAWKYQLNMLNVGCDVHHFMPLPIFKIPFFFTAIKNFYDDDVWVGYNELNTMYRSLRGKKGSYSDVSEALA